MYKAKDFHYTKTYKKCYLKVTLHIHVFVLIKEKPNQTVNQKGKRNLKIFKIKINKKTTKYLQLHMMVDVQD